MGRRRSQRADAMAAAVASGQRPSDVARDYGVSTQAVNKACETRGVIRGAVAACSFCPTATALRQRIHILECRLGMNGCPTGDDPVSVEHNGPCDCDEANSAGRQ